MTALHGLHQRLANTLSAKLRFHVHRMELNRFSRNGEIDRACRHATDMCKEAAFLSGRSGQAWHFTYREHAAVSLNT
nr:hypothetical protein [Noviherbaspirillum cavernae]